MSAESSAAHESKLVVRRHVQASPQEVFALLSDPSRHDQTEPGDWVGEAIHPEPITGVGQVFGMRMFHVNAGGHYRMDNRVTAFDPDTRIAWAPGQYDDDAHLSTGGWVWQYDLAAGHGGTEVTLTYDWSAVPESLRSELGLPPFGPEFLEESLEALDRAL
ncbi:SRPBCC family protein [Garicola koreensis]|uniref:Uncharacterized protein YndB with AHSA1/START domain n=1 Tax=Garicola koreensis TaxID=1262554 RepID=A0A7W5XK39_9MICC|nr:SRPBCC family protein [Garicola koreensis]MBB3667097.1 uncharacterized protein YndB with AHSA1/START domain [Garicola koreensis]